MADHLHLRDFLQTGEAEDLRRKPWSGHSNPLAGHCYVASEAIYHWYGGKSAGWKPMFVRVNGQPHWFLRSDVTGEIVDVTAGQFHPNQIDYNSAVGKGFLTKRPSKRAKALIHRWRAWANVEGS